ncbi:hypothetical protein R50073_01940 [Maricurvus nonylphenolicus]|uniref:DUF4136 domain-containing protein n=1 Tax=Maricurvus nonylphenolicus TaxID=1008307 RepID=UPI0036F2AEB8
MMRILAWISVVLFVAGCSTSGSMPDNPLSQRVTVTVSSGDELPVTSTTPLSWYSDVITVSDVEAPEGAKAQRDSLKELLKESVQENLQTKGFSFAEEGSDSRYQLVVVALLGDKANAENVQQLFQLYPSLSGESDKYPKGTLLVGILDQETNRAVWRGATQAFTSAELTHEERRQRLNYSVGGLLKDVKPGT